MKKYLSLLSIAFALTFVLVTGCTNKNGTNQPGEQDNRDSLIMNEPQDDLLNQDQNQSDSADNQNKNDTADF